MIDVNNFLIFILLLLFNEYPCHVCKGLLEKKLCFFFPAMRGQVKKHA